MKSYTNVLELFSEISQRLRNMQKEIAYKLKINLSQYKILTILGLKQSPVSQSELSEVCCIDRPAVSRLVGKMTKDHLLETHSHENNRKTIYITLTNEGKDLVEKIKNASIDIKRKYFNELDSKNKTLFLNLLSKTLAEEKENA